MKKIDLETWPRRELYKFFQTFATPCFNMSFNIDVKKVYEYSKSSGESFFLLCFYVFLKASNKVPQFRQRIINNEPVEFEKIVGVTPIENHEGTINIIACQYFDTFKAFKDFNLPRIEHAKVTSAMPPEEDTEDFICLSCIPWIHFTSMTQAETDPHCAVPILAWGKMENGVIPVSLKVNHSFVDAEHIAKFIDCLNENFAQPELI